MRVISILALAAIVEQAKALIRGDESHASRHKRKKNVRRRMKSSKSKGETLCAIVDDPYPGYTGTIRASGSVDVTFPDRGMTEFAYDLQGLESDCTDCGIHIHFGTSCAIAAEVGGHYYSAEEVETDPWTPGGGAVYNTDSAGSATGSFVLTSGFDTYDENIGHAVVVHAADGTRVTCSLLKSSTNGICEAVENRRLYASANDPYPGYTGDIDVIGSFTVTFPSPDSLEFSYNLQGLEGNCENCGVHIHSGTTCKNADEVGGHFFSTEEDPWAAGGVAVYNSDTNGFAKGSFTLTSGVDTYEDNIGHAVVVHAADGTRITCGILDSFARKVENEVQLTNVKK